MNRTPLGILSLILFVIITFSACGPENRPSPDNENGKYQGVIPQRVISTVPSITEALFELGLEDKLVGVSSFCNYPPELREMNLPKLGGLTQNREVTIALDPELVFILQENRDLIDFYRSHGIRVIAIDHTSVPGILESFRVMAEPFGPEYVQRAQELKSNMEFRLHEIESESANFSPPPRILICLDRDHSEEGLRSMYVAGKQPFFNDILKILGAENAIREDMISSPIISTETVLRADPDVILDLSLGYIPSKNKNLGKEDWNTLGNDVKAVRNNNVYIIAEDYATVPGPRFILLVEQIAGIIHKN